MSEHTWNDDGPGTSKERNRAVIARARALLERMKNFEQECAAENERTGRNERLLNLQLEQGEQQGQPRERTGQQYDRVVQRDYEPGDKVVYREREQQVAPRVLLNEPVHATNEAAPAQPTSRPDDRTGFDVAWNSWADARIKCWTMPRLEALAEVVGEEVSADIKKLRLEVSALRHELEVTRGLLAGKVSRKDFDAYEAA